MHAARELNGGRAQAEARALGEEAKHETDQQPSQGTGLGLANGIDEGVERHDGIGVSPYIRRLDMSLNPSMRNG